MRAAHRQIETALAQELLDRIHSAPPEFFERLIVNLLLNMGFGGSVADAGRALGRSGDDGVDGVINQDALGLDRVYIQAKRYAPGNNIGSGAIRDFFGSLDRHKATKGLFVTTSTFSASATETAQYLSKRIVLIGGEQLAKLMIRHNVGCRVEGTLQGFSCHAGAEFKTLHKSRSLTFSEGCVMQKILAKVRRIATLPASKFLAIRG
jgi:restriction system protein